MPRDYLSRSLCLCGSTFSDLRYRELVGAEEDRAVDDGRARPALRRRAGLAASSSNSMPGFSTMVLPESSRQ